MQTFKELFIGGEWVSPDSSEVIEVISPASEEVIGQVPHASTADADKAIAAAREAFDEGPWPHMTPVERGEAIGRLSAALQARALDLADTISSQNGSPKQWSMMGQVFSSTMVLDTYAAMATQYEWVDTRTGMMGGPVRVRRAPVGVVAAITPWNVPLFIAALKLGPGLLAGCTFVLKPAPETPLDSYALADAIAEAGIPEGVVNILPAGRETGEYIVKHPAIDKVSFTGSTAAGMRIGELCGGQLKRCTLELGGKSAAIVLDDADLDDAMLDQLVQSGLMNNGQVCGAQSRILVSRKRYSEVVDALGGALGALKVGDPLDETTQIGPLVAERQRTRVEGYIDAGKAAGARVVVGGGRPADLAEGLVRRADGVRRRRQLDEDRAGGDLRPGAVGHPLRRRRQCGEDRQRLRVRPVWIGVDFRPERGEQIAARVRTGVVAINSSMILDFNSPFGGFKKSGIGRELGPEGVAPYTELQSIVLPAG